MKDDVSIASLVQALKDSQEQSKREIEAAEKQNSARWAKINAWVFTALIAVLVFVFFTVNERLYTLEKQSNAQALILQETATRLEAIARNGDKLTADVRQLQSIHLKK